VWVPAGSEARFLAPLPVRKIPGIGEVTERALRALGIDTVEQLATLVERVEITPAFVQNRCFARNRWDADIRALCERHDIVYQGFSLLTANQQVLSSPRITAVARRHGKTIPQVVFRFAVQLGMLPLSGTTDSLHMRQDLDIFDFVLSDEDLQTMLEIGAL